MRWTLPLVVGLVLSACATGAETTTTLDRAGFVESEVSGTEAVTIEVDGRTRAFLLHVPDDLTEPVPLVVALHGFTSEPDRFEDLTGLSAGADGAGFLVAYPRGTGALAAWNLEDDGVDDVAFLDAVVSTIADRFQVSSVVVAGFSNGGGMAARYGCDRTVAGVVVVSGAHRQLCVPTETTSVIAIHGDADRIVPLDGVGQALVGFEPWVGAWAEALGCEDFEAGTLGSDVDISRGTDCSLDSYVIQGGEHGWPGAERSVAAGSSTATFSATDLILDLVETTVSNLP